MYVNSAENSPSRAIFALILVENTSGGAVYVLILTINSLVRAMYALIYLKTRHAEQLSR